MCSEPVTDQQPFLTPCSFLGLWVEYLLQPLEANLGVRVARLGARIIPPWCGVRRPVASMGGRRPNHHRVQISSSCTYALDRSDHSSLYSCTSIISLIVLSHQHIDRSERREHDSSLVPVVDILCQNCFVIQYFTDHVKPVFYLPIYVLVMALPI